MSSISVCSFASLYQYLANSIEITLYHLEYIFSLHEMHKSCSLFNIFVYTVRKLARGKSSVLWFHQINFCDALTFFPLFFSRFHRVFPSVDKRLDDINVHEVQNLAQQHNMFTWQPCSRGSFQFFFQSKYHFYSFRDVHFHVSWLIVQIRCGILMPMGNKSVHESLECISAVFTLS